MMPKKKNTSQQKVDLTERPAQGGDAQPRRESAQSESSFRSTDKLFDDDPQATTQAATPNPEYRRPTIKGLKHKVAKTLGLSKGSSSSTTPSDDTSGARGSNSGTEQIPSLSLSPVHVMTHKASPRSPTSSDGVWTDPSCSVTTSPLTGPLLSAPLDDDATVSCPGLDEEEKTVGYREFTTTSKEEQASRMERAAQRSRASSAVETAKQLSHINKLKEQVKDLKEKLKAKNEELRSKLDQTDIEHQDIEQQLKTAKKTSDAQLEAHKEEIKQKDIEITKAAVQVKSLQELNDKAKREEPPQQQIDDITQQLTEQWTAITQSHKVKHEQKIQQLKETHSNEIMKLTREHQKEIKTARSVHPSREELEKEIRDEYEKRRDEDIQKAALNQQLKDEYEQKLNQIRDDHIKALAEKTQKYKEEVAALRKQARTLELKYLKKEDNLAGKHCSPSTSPEQGRHVGEVDQNHQMIADIDREKDHLKTELAVQQQVVCDLQYELDHQKNLHGQLELQTVTKQQLSLSLSPTGDELLVDQQDNRTDAEKLRDELEEVTRKAEQDAVTYRQQTKDLQTQVEDLIQRLNDSTTSNVKFQEAIKIAIEQAPPSAGGIQAGDEGDSAKLLQLIKGKYLEKVTEIVELKQQFDRKMSNLTEKIHEKDHQLKVQRDNRSRASVDDTDEDEESSIAELRATLRTKDQEIQSLTIQLQTFQQVASQRQQLQEHSKAQSTVVANLKKELAAAQRDLAKTQGVVSSLTGNSKPASQQVRTDQRGMQLLTAEVNLCKIEREIEVKEHEKKVERLNSEVTELGKANLSLERRLRESNEERDVLSLQSVELLASKHSYKGQLDVTQEHLTQLTSTIMLKTEENEQLKEKLKTVEEELEITKFVVFQYQQDFKEERAARVQAIGAKDTEYGKFSMRVQTLSDQLRESKAEAETEKQKKQAVIAELETTLTEKQQLTKQLTQTEEDLDRTLATKLQEIREESTQLMAQMEHLRTESMKFQRQQQTAEATYERREAELVEDLVAIKQELSHTKQNCSRTATELQDARQRLKVSLADTECLHDEVMSKTAQVKQYKKQTDSFKAKMEEANTKLLKTQQELQRCQELINTMEMDSQDQNRERIDYLERTAVDRQSVISGLASNIRSQKQHIHQLEVEIEHQKEANGRLEARLERQDELAPYCVSQVLSLGQQEGSGSYGSIYLTQLNGINCVAKRVHDILLGHGNVERLSLEDKRAAYEKFYSECVLLSRMRHPNIVQFMGVYYGPQRDYGRELTLVMERLYMNLYDCLHRYPNIEMWLKISILLDVSQGLLHLHSQGIVHRDLTTPNVLLTTSFHAKIADLGVSKIIQVCGTKQTTAPGNPDYMPPEALTEIPTYGYALDIFSFGVIMLFVLTQKYPKPYEVPFTVTGVQRKEIQIQKRMKWIAKLSPEDPMRQLICCCLQDDPQKRLITQELNSTLIRFAQQFPKPFVDTIEMRRKCIPTTPPIPLPRRLSQGQQ